MTKYDKCGMSFQLRAIHKIRKQLKLQGHDAVEDKDFGNYGQWRTTCEHIPQRVAETEIRKRLQKRV
jgi:hypothetical protein